MFISQHIVEVDGVERWVTLYDDRAFVGHGRAQLKRGSKAFRSYLKRLHEQSDPGSLTREHMAKCADTVALVEPVAKSVDRQISMFPKD